MNYRNQSYSADLSLMEDEVFEHTLSPQDKRNVDSLKRSGLVDEALLHQTRGRLLIIAIAKARNGEDPDIALAYLSQIIHIEPPTPHIGEDLICVGLELLPTRPNIGEAMLQIAGIDMMGDHK